MHHELSVSPWSLVRQRHPAQLRNLQTSYLVGMGHWCETRGRGFLASRALFPVEGGIHLLMLQTFFVSISGMPLSIYEEEQIHAFWFHVWTC